MGLSVHLLQRFDAAWIGRLEAGLEPGIRLSSGEVAPSPADYEILIAGLPRRDHLTASPRLKTLIIPWSGLPEATRKLALEFPHIAVHNIHHNAAPAAEAAVALMLAAARMTAPIDRALRSNDWTPRYHYGESIPRGPLLLSGKTALIAGYGAIGRRIAAACRGLEMNVIAIKRDTGTGGDAAIDILGPGEFRRLLPRADVLFICLPHTSDTRGSIGREELALLPDGAIIVNIARGPIIDEKALYDALAGPRDLRAGLDVWYNYPATIELQTATPPSKYPFHELDNVVMSPHMGGHADQTEALRIAALRDMLATAARGEPLPNRVDLHRGY